MSFKNKLNKARARRLLHSFVTQPPNLHPNFSECDLNLNRLCANRAYTISCKGAWVFLNMVQLFFFSRTLDFAGGIIKNLFDIFLQLRPESEYSLTLLLQLQEKNIFYSRH